MKTRHKYLLGLPLFNFLKKLKSGFLFYSLFFISIISLAHEHEHEHEHDKEHDKEEPHASHTQLTPEALKNSDIKLELSGPQVLRIYFPVQGQIIANEDHLVHVSPRFPGVVKEVKKRLGDEVKAGDVLAIIESNANLLKYEIKSLLSGTVVKKDVSLGEFISEKDTIYTIADLSDVWVDLNVYKQDFNKIKVGQMLKIQSPEVAPTIISYISPFGSQNTQSMLARAVLANPNRELLPGLFVSGKLLLEEVKVPLAVKSEAIQTFNQQEVIFIQDGVLFKPLPIKLGKNDGTWVEVLGGLKQKQTYVSKNSFIIKADILKQSASHEH